jgi:hypothetical protein
MNRACAFMLSLALALPAVPGLAATLTASVDRSQLGVGETFELTLSSDDVTQFGKPDLSPLDADFEVRDTRQINRLSSLDSTAEAATRWIVTLLPRQAGELSIAPLQLGDARSAALKVQVSAAPAVSESRQPVFIEASLDVDNVYVQAQAVLTLRVYHSVALFDDSLLAPVEIGDARIERLGDTRAYEKIIKGVRHGVIESRFALYPQHSGRLEIPAQVFNAILVDNADGGTGAARPGQQLRVTSAQIPLLVHPRPASWPADTPWLPARSLSLSESWNPEPSQSQVGDSLTRTVNIKAEGLSSAQLPPLPTIGVNGLRRYPDQPQLNDQATDLGLVGSRTEREALVPARSGTLELPGVDVTWWNTYEDHLEHSRLPSRNLQVVDNPSLAIEAPVSDVRSSPDDTLVWPWKLATVLFAFSTLAGFILWWRARSQPAVQRTASVGPSPQGLLDDLKRACQANDPQATRQALDAWARQQPETLADLAARFVPLSDALDGLNGALYSEAGRYWQGAELWRAITAIAAAWRETVTPADHTALPPLYPK